MALEAKPGNVKANVITSIDLPWPSPSAPPPAIVPPTLAPLAPLSPNTSLEDHLNHDAHLCHFVLGNLINAWTQVNTTKGVCQLASTTMSFLQKRRDLFLKPSAAENTKAKGGGILYPLD